LPLYVTLRDHLLSLPLAAIMLRLVLASYLVFLSSSLEAVAQQSIDGFFEDIDESLDQPVDQKVEVVQDSPHSNSVHVAHNNPVGSDIYVEQTSPYNASVHISLNIARDSKVEKGIIFA